MANNFFENFRNAVGIEKNPWGGNQRMRFPQSVQGYDGREQSLRNLNNAERNFGISERSKNALMDRGVDNNSQSIPIPLLDVQTENRGRSLESSDSKTSLSGMNVWRLDGQPFNLNSYLGSVQKVKDEISKATDKDSLIKALKKETNDWGMNVHALGNQIARQQDTPDITPRVLLENYIKWATDEAGDMDIEELKAELLDGINVDMVPKVVREGRLI